MARFLEGDTEADPRPSPLAPVEDRGKGRPPKRTRAHARSSAAMLQAADAEVDHAVHQRAAKRARQAHEHGDADSEESESDLSPSPARGMALLRDSRLERASVAGAVQPTDVVIGDATTREHKAPPVEKSPDSEATPVCLPREPAQPSAGAFRWGPPYGDVIRWRRTEADSDSTECCLCHASGGSARAARRWFSSRSLQHHEGAVVPGTRHSSRRRGDLIVRA